MGRGGARAGSGRKPGVTVTKREIAEAEARATGETPKEFMLRVMRDPKSTPEQQMEAALELLQSVTF
jgi:hypothetical protein